MKRISVRMKRRISKTKMLKGKQMCYQQSIERKQLKSIIYKKKMNYLYDYPSGYKRLNHEG